MINRSGIEVAVDTEPECPVVLVRDVIAAERIRETARNYTRRVYRGALHLLIQDVHAHVEVLGHVPLSTRTEPPGLPVIVAAHVGNRVGAEFA